jgi:multimeric flavodoxin WrbA
MSDKIKAVAFNGSPRVGGNTEILLKKILTLLENKNIDTEFVQLGGKLLHGCTACSKCRQNLNSKCAIESDEINSFIAKMISAQIILIGSPTYFADVTTEVKALIDRSGYVARGNNSLLKNKIGAAVIAVRRAGAIHAFDTINHFFLINGMIVPGSTYWNLGIGKNKGEVEKDSEGIDNMNDLAKQLAFVAKKIHCNNHI